MRMSELVKKRKAIDKARVEYHSFMSVRLLHDIHSSYDLTKTMLRLERNLINANNDFDNVVAKI